MLLVARSSLESARDPPHSFPDCTREMRIAPPALHLRPKRPASASPIPTAFGRINMSADAPGRVAHPHRRITCCTALSRPPSSSPRNVPTEADQSAAAEMRGKEVWRRWPARTRAPCDERRCGEGRTGAAVWWEAATTGMWVVLAARRLRRPVIARRGRWRADRDGYACASASEK
eukprot:364875-Chlamydomonas_euryale.AAC.7